MASSGQYGHAADGRQPVQRANAAGYAHCIVSENIAYVYRSSGYDTVALAAKLVEGWQQSPGHRKNMLDAAVTQTGAGVARDAAGRYFAVQMFGLPKSAAVRFSVRNAAGSEVHYRLGEQRLALPPRAERRHLMCRASPLRLPGKSEAVVPRDGARYTIERTARSP